MAGICGVVHKDLDFRFDRARLRNMRDSLACRGPDGWTEHVAGRVALASRRLCLVDLNADRRVPATSADGRHAIVCDGTVLNYRSLRSTLDPPPGGFRSNTDSEVLLHLYAQRGPAMLDSLNGAFAFAIWDNEKGELFLARDRLGMKPLCYAVRGGAFYFASEEKALFAAGLANEFDESIWPELMVFRYVAGERTPFRGVSRLLPGHYLTWRDGDYRTTRWWNLGERTLARREDLPSQPCEWFSATLDDAVRLCRTGEVPVGLLLSAGLDSAAIAACLSAEGAAGLASFTVLSAEPGHNDGAQAQAVADACDLDYHELPLAPDELAGLIEPATWLDDVPLAHGFETQLLGVAEYANSRARILLSGAGGDETLGGYMRYWPLRWPALAGGAGASNARGLLRLNGPVGRLARWPRLGSPGGFVMFNGCNVLPPDIEALGCEPCPEFPYREQVLEEALRVYPEQPVRQALYLDQHTYLVSVVDRIDRMTMGASAECRLPLLDYRLVEGLAALPGSVLLPCRRSKGLLRQAMGARLPDGIRSGHKWGSGIPWGHYLRNVPFLRRMVEALPNTGPVRGGPFRPLLVRRVADAFLSGDDYYEPLIRRLLMTAVWFENCVRTTNLRGRAARAGGIYL